MGHSQRHAARLADVMKNDDRAGNQSTPIVNRRSRILYGRLGPTAPHQNAVWRQAHGLVLPNCQFHGIGRGLAGLAVNNAKHLGEWTAYCLLTRPPRQLFRDQIEIGNLTYDVGAKHAVADGVKGGLRAFLFYE